MCWTQIIIIMYHMEVENIDLNFVDFHVHKLMRFLPRELIQNMNWIPEFFIKKSATTEKKPFKAEQKSTFYFHTQAEKVKDKQEIKSYM